MPCAFLANSLYVKNIWNLTIIYINKLYHCPHDVQVNFIWWCIFSNMSDKRNDTYMPENPISPVYLLPIDHPSRAESIICFAPLSRIHFCYWWCNSVTIPPCLLVTKSAPQNIILYFFYHDSDETCVILWLIYLKAPYAAQCLETGLVFLQSHSWASPSTRGETFSQTSEW